MPVDNAVEIKHGRIYRYIKPNASNPGTWRLSAPETGLGSGGGGGGGSQDIDGTLPIVATTVPGPVTTTTISFNIQRLPSRV